MDPYKVARDPYKVEFECFPEWERVNVGLLLKAELGFQEYAS